MSCLSRPAKSINNFPRLSAASEVALLLMFVFLMAWTVPTMPAGLRLYSAIMILTWIFGLTIMSHITYGETLEDLGLGKRYIGQGFLELAGPVAVLALVMVDLGLAFRTLHFTRKFLLQLIGIPFWALFQQYAAQSFINRRLQIVFGPGNKSILFTALIFAGIHLPNPALAIATAVAGLIWARAFQRAPNLYAIALSHGLLSALFVNVMPKWLLPNMKVGYNYFFP